VQAALQPTAAAAAAAAARGLVVVAQVEARVALSAEMIVRNGARCDSRRACVAVGINERKQERLEEVPQTVM
jgi:hypothetical protein